VRLARDDGPEGFGADLDDLLRRAREATGPAGASAQDRFIDRLVAAIERQQLAPAVFLLARSVKRAMDQVRESGGQCDGDALAAAAGVTSRTLRNSFRACLGLTLATFIQQEQLETVRRQLASARESRTIQAIAEAAGFASAIAFSRAYQRCFGETPTQTRVRAVREAGSS
jgi:AraC-like DNA-binding protein